MRGPLFRSWEARGVMGDAPRNGRCLSYAEQPFDLRGMKVLGSGEAVWGSFVFDKKGICWIPTLWPRPFNPRAPANNAPIGTWVSPQLKKSQERERSLLQMVGRELNRFFPQPRKKGREKGCGGTRGEWEGRPGRRGWGKKGRIWEVKSLVISLLLFPVNTAFQKTMQTGWFCVFVRKKKSIQLLGDFGWTDNFLERKYNTRKYNPFILLCFWRGKVSPFKSFHC